MVSITGQTMVLEFSPILQQNERSFQVGPAELCGNEKRCEQAPFQKRLYPSRHALAVAVKESQHLTGSIGGTDQTCPDQTFSLFGADETHAFQITDVASKLGLQVAWISKKGVRSIFWIAELHSRHAENKQSSWDSEILAQNNWKSTQCHRLVSFLRLETVNKPLCVCQMAVGR